MACSGSRDSLQCRLTEHVLEKELRNWPTFSQVMTRNPWSCFLYWDVSI